MTLNRSGQRLDLYPFYDSHAAAVRDRQHDFFGREILRKKGAANLLLKNACAFKVGLAEINAA